MRHSIELTWVGLTSALIAACTIQEAKEDRAATPEAREETSPASDGGSGPSVTTDGGAQRPAVSCTAGPDANRPGYDLVWCDEFDGREIDRTKWNFDLADGAFLPSGPGWGNQEKEFYTSRSVNAKLDAGKLVISALKDGPHYANGPAYSSVYDYSSARLHTKGKADFRYGRMEVRAKLPKGQGLWPAIWMLPTDQEYGGWPSSGEIDIMEFRGQEPTTVLGTLHFGHMWPKNGYVGCEVTGAVDYTTDFHTFAVDWSQDRIQWFVDDVLFETQVARGAAKPANTCEPVPASTSVLNSNENVPDPAGGWFSSTADAPAPFDRRFHFVLNVAVGGQFVGGDVDPSVFPQTMEVEYVRVYQKP